MQLFMKRIIFCKVVKKSKILRGSLLAFVERCVYIYLNNIYIASDGFVGYSNGLAFGKSILFIFEVNVVIVFSKTLIFNDLRNQ